MNNPSYCLLRPSLENLAEEKYRTFHTRLVPGIHDFLGVRLPLLRSLAREFAKRLTSGADWMAFFSQTPLLYEEVMLRGILIGQMPPRLLREAAAADASEPQAFYFRLVASQIPYIDNWALCDCFCTGLKQKAFLNDLFLETLCRELLFPPEAGCWPVRVGLVLMRSHFTDTTHILQILEACRVVSARLSGADAGEFFYVRMGMAWLLSECYIRCRTETAAFLFGPDAAVNLPDPWIFHKTIQKILESDRIGSEEKALLRKKKGRV